MIVKWGCPLEQLSESFSRLEVKNKLEYAIKNIPVYLLITPSGGNNTDKLCGVLCYLQNTFT
jgi:hypothetical protein